MNIKLTNWTPIEIFKKIGRRVGYYKYVQHKRNENKSSSVFVWIPKTAGTSIYKTLESHGFLKLLNTDSIKFYFPQNGGVTFGHMSYVELVEKNFVKQKFNTDAFKFTFVRNPYDRAISLYEYYRLLNRLEKSVSFDEFSSLVKNEEYQKLGLFNDGHLSHCNKQTSYLYNSSGELIVDFIGKVENITDDFKHICDKLDISNNLYHINKSPRRKFDDYYTSQQVIDNIYKAYEEDFDNFKYPKKLK
jgi:hypothetical protein